MTRCICGPGVVVVHGINCPFATVTAPASAPTPPTDDDCANPSCHHPADEHGAAGCYHVYPDEPARLCRCARFEDMAAVFPNRRAAVPAAPEGGETSGPTPNSGSTSSSVGTSRAPDRLREAVTDDDVRHAVCVFNGWDFAEMGASVSLRDVRSRDMRSVLTDFVSRRAALRGDA